MEEKTTSMIVVTLLTACLFTLACDVKTVEAYNMIFIRANGNVEPSTAPILNVGNVFYTFIGDIYGSITVEREGAIVDGNGYTLRYPWTIGFYLIGANNVTIKNVNMLDFNIGIYLAGSSHNTICANNITANLSRGILLDSSHNNTITANNISNSEHSGIELDWSSNNTITQNNITDNLGGICLYYSNGNTITENNIANNIEGVYLSYYSNDNIIRANNITASYYDAVVLEDSFNNSICTNDITANANGIRFSAFPSGNKVEANNIVNNGAGVYFYGGLDNKLYHNNFITNEFQVYVEPPGFENAWDDGYPSGGNYWSDYSGEDKFRGSDQNLHGSDGIGDTSYIVDAQNIDHYPLMNPWAPTETSVRVKGKDYPVTIISNCTIDQIIVTKNTLHFKASGPPGKIGYINIIFPMVNTTAIKVFIDGKKLTPPPFPVINTNGTHYFIYFEFTLSTRAVAVQFAPVTARIVIDPLTLCLRSQGQWITAFIQLPEGYNAEDIDAASILLNGTISPVLDPTFGFVTNPSEYLTDHDGDGVLERMVKFDRALVTSFIYAQGIRYGDVALTVTGELRDGVFFEGTGTVFVNYAGDVNNDGIVNILDASILSAHWYPGPPIGLLGYNANGDFNKDGAIDILDAGMLSANWGQTTPRL